MCCEKLSLQGFINEVKDVNVGPHPRKFCFILGAGASRSSGIKSGQELINMWDKELAERNYEEYMKWKEELNINDENKYNHYSHYYEKRFSKHPSDGYNYLEKIMEKAKPSIGYVLLSYILTKTSNNVVITTNFDHLIEDAVNYYAQTMPLVIGHESLAHYVTTKITRPTIIKIHRDLLFDPANKSNEIEELHENWKKAIEEIFQNYNPVFIGYAGNDNSLMNYLKTNCDRFSNNTFCSPYWMLYKEDKLEGKVKEFLDHSNSYYIYHNGFDETIYQLTAALDIKLPTKDNLDRETDYRYQKIADSIDKFTQMIYNRDAGKESCLNNKNKEEIENINSAVLKITSQIEAQNKFREATTLLIEGHHEHALNISNELIENYPQNARYYILKTNVLEHMNKYEEAIKVCKKAIKIDSENDSYYAVLIGLYDSTKNYDKAIEACCKAIEIVPENDGYYAILASFYEEMGNYDKAIETYHKAIEIAPENDSYYHDLGDLYEEVENHDKAIEAYCKAIEIAPENDNYYAVLANIYEKKRNYDKAIEAYHKAIKISPKDDIYYSDLADLYKKIGNYNKAIEAYHKVIEIKPEMKIIIESIIKQIYRNMGDEE